MKSAITLLALAQQFNSTFSDQCVRSEDFAEHVAPLFGDAAFSKLLMTVSYLARRFNATALNTPYMQTLMTHKEAAKLNRRASKDIADMEKFVRFLGERLPHAYLADMMPKEARNNEVAASYIIHNAPTLARLCEPTAP